MPSSSRPRGILPYLTLTKASTPSRRSMCRCSLGIVETMSCFRCLRCGGRSEIFSHRGARQEAKRLGTEFLGEVPLDRKARETSDGGSLIIVSEPDNPRVLVFRHIAGRI